MMAARNGGKSPPLAALSSGRISLNKIAMISVYSNKRLCGYNPPFTELYSSVIK